MADDNTNTSKSAEGRGSKNPNMKDLDQLISQAREAGAEEAKKAGADRPQRSSEKHMSSSLDAEKPTGGVPKKIPNIL